MEKAAAKAAALWVGRVKTEGRLEQYLPGVPETDSRPLWRSTSSAVFSRPRRVSSPRGVSSNSQASRSENRAPFSRKEGFSWGASPE